MNTGQYQLSFLAGLLASFCLGIVGSAWQHLSLSSHLLYFIFFLTAAALASGVLLLRADPRTWIAFAGLFFILGAFRFSAVYELPAHDISRLSGQDAVVAGILTDAPRVSTGADGVRRIRYTAEIQTATVGREIHTVSGKIFIYMRLPDDVPVGQIGDKIKAAGKLRRPHGYQNPGQIDTAFLMRTQGVTATLSVREGAADIASEESPTIIQKAFRYAEAIRSHYLNRMDAVMPHTDAAAIFAMLFGGYEGIRPELLEAFTTTGIVHILSVSGSHITLLAAVTAWIALCLRLPRWGTAAMVICTITAYVILAGLVPPAVRSGIMGAVAFLGIILGRERDAQHLLLLTGLIMLLISPLLFFHISFQLSFLATAGLLFLSPVLHERMARLPRMLAGSLSITIGAQLATLPVLAWYFNQLSLSSLLANLIVVPVVELIIILGLAGGILAFFLPIFGSIIFACDSLLLGMAFELTRGIAALPFAKIWLPTMDIFSMICYYAVLGWMIMPQRYRETGINICCAQRKLLGILVCVVLLSIFIWRAVRPDEMAVHFIDVGQGDCTLVVTPHGHAMLFDTGGTRDAGFDIGGRVDIPYLLHNGIRAVDYIFLTHAHEDHAAGAGPILSYMPVRQVYTAAEGTAAYARSMRLGDANPLLGKLTRAEAGESFTIDNVCVDVLYAPPLDEADNATGNEVCNVYRVRYGNASFLLTGDLVREHEAKMLSHQGNLTTTVVKIPHHGSDTSSSEEFIAATSPLYAVCCVGADNAFGHPRPAVLKRYEQRGAQILRTDRDGAIIFRTDGTHLRVSTYAAEKFLGN
ncbi:DNA internalization-related competence protein ComEC/Rec2 [uncultured Selenomonas sp.]|uniref:DNA internalization-related competence protein ComEC/Rec2 n=1 Tax=uncultured Selenomonas sp. TaxID=159275 RepID=UPI0028D22422|nr:DNA internalization-related competence protein ComEC/Rec2 [uncultured Selenomonas sp.]